jgi:hypothetical protein
MAALGNGAATGKCVVKSKTQLTSREAEAWQLGPSDQRTLEGNLEGKENGGVPRVLVCFVGVLNSPPDVAEQVIGIVQVVSGAESHS